MPYEDEKKKGAAPVPPSLRPNCLFDRALLSSLFSFSTAIPFRDFFFFQKERRRTKRSGGEEARFRRSLRVNRWKSGLPSHHREREARSLRKVRGDRSIGSKEFISDIYAKRSTYFKRVPNESIIERNIMAHCSLVRVNAPPLNLYIVLELQNREDTARLWNSGASSVSVLAIVFDRLSGRWTVVGRE